MKTKMIKLLLSGAVLITAGGMAAQAQTSDSSDIDQLKAQMQSMQTNMEAMQHKINELEREKAAANQAPTNEVQLTVSTNQGNVNVNVFVGTASPVRDRGSLNDQQAGVPRLNNQTLDTKYYGFFPIPNTPGIMQLNAKPRLDAMADTKNTGNPDRFVTATIPTTGGGGGDQFNMNAQGSQLSADVRAPSVPGDFRFYYQNDFFGSGGGAMPYRLRQLYGQFYNITAGFTYSFFEDPDVWPDTVDYEGPNSAIFARQPIALYKYPLGEGFQLNVGMQQPATDLDTAGTAPPNATAVNHAPDAGFNVRWENSERGHVQMAWIFRDLGANNTALGDQNVFGWGMNLSANLNTCGKDTLQAQFTYGDGIFHFCNDNFTYTGFNGGDAAFDAAGHLKALAYIAPMAGYTHYWCDNVRSTVSAGYVHLQNEASQSPDAYHQTVYTSMNVVWQLRKRLSIGLESLYGYKQDQDQAHRAVWRFQTGLVYSLF
jgi:hypothetical protein